MSRAKRHVPDIEENDQDTIKQLRRRRLYHVLLVSFFLCMMVFTVLSRVVDSYSVPRVRTGSAGPGSVLKTIEGDGTVEAEETRRVPLLSGLTVGRVEAGPGVEVKAGDTLFYYDPDSLLKKRRELLKEIRKLELANEAERLGAVSYAGVTSVELAAQELAAAGQAYERQQGKTKRAGDEYAQNLADIKKYYDKRLELSREELMEQSRDDYNQSRNALDNTKRERDLALRNLKRKIGDTEKKIQRLEEKENPSEGDQDQLEELKGLLEQYENELEMTEEEWDLKLEQAEDDRNEKEDIYDRAGRGMDAARLELRENYKAAVKREEKNLEAAWEEELNSALALQKAQQSLENARKEDQARALTADQAGRLAELNCQARQVDIDGKQEELKEVDDLIGRGGAVAAPVGGVTSLAELESGKETAGDERYLISVGELHLAGTFKRDEESSMEAGDEIKIMLRGEERPITVQASSVDLVSDKDQGTFTAKLPAGTGTLGESASFTCEKKTDLYQTVLPSSAVRKDANGEFCLILRPVKTILGEEYKAARVDFKVLARGDTKVAVDGGLMPEDRIILSGDRIVGAGDRVRPVQELSGGTP